MNKRDSRSDKYEKKRAYAFQISFCLRSCNALKGTYLSLGRLFMNVIRLSLNFRYNKMKKNDLLPQLTVIKTNLYQ
jgi:hypothetical protein